MNLTFEQPIYLIALLILPLIVFTHFYMLKYKKINAMKFANFETLKRIDDRWFFSKNVIQLILRIIFTILIIFAFAGPKIGYSAFGQDYNIIFAIDNSGSMLAKDIEPTRLDAVKDMTSAYLDTITTGATVGLVSFSGMAFIEEAPTDDFGSIVSSIRSLKVSGIPGTAVGDAIKTSVTLLSIIPNKKGGAIILLTDGQENVLKEEEFFSIVDYSKKQGIPTHIIAIGSMEGGASELLEGGSRFSLNPDTLKKVAEITGGTYMEASTREAIREGLDTLIDPRSITRTRPFGNLLFLIAIIILFIEWNFSNYHFRRFP